MTLRRLTLATLAAALCLTPLHAQEQSASPATAIPCCTVVSPEGRHLDAIIDSMHVNELWQAKVHINWETGIQDEPSSTSGPDRATHCSSFSAALGKKLGIYMLRPPDHPQQLLASAQARWFRTPEASKDGWTPVANATEAQGLANKGELVVVIYESPDAHRPGHVAIVRPGPVTPAEMDEHGVRTAQAGALNFSSGYAKISFAKHEGAWPNGVRYYAHPIDWSTIPPTPNNYSTTKPN